MGWEGTEREQPRQGWAGGKEGCKKLHLHPGGRGPEGLIPFFKECERPPLESLLPPESRDGKGNQLHPQQLGVRLESGNLRVRCGVDSREKSEVPSLGDPLDARPSGSWGWQLLAKLWGQSGTLLWGGGCLTRDPHLACCWVPRVHAGATHSLGSFGGPGSTRDLDGTAPSCSPLLPHQSGTPFPDP